MTDEAEIVQIIGFLDDIISAANGYKDALFGGLISLLKVQHERLVNSIVSFSNGLKTHEAFLQQKGLDERLKIAKTAIFERLNELDTRIAEHLTGVEEEDFAKDSVTYRALFVEYGFEDCLERLKETANDAKIVLESLLKPKTKSYLDVAVVDDTAKTFQDALKTYASWTKQIQSTIIQIQVAPYYGKKLHERVKHGKWTGYPHARITENLHLMYLYDAETRKIILVDIITKNELDKS